MLLSGTGLVLACRSDSESYYGFDRDRRGIRYRLNNSLKQLPRKKVK